jgi:hypothetical protein
MSIDAVASSRYYRSRRVVVTRRGTYRTVSRSRRSTTSRSTSRRRGYHPSYVKYRSRIETGKKLRGFSRKYKVTKPVSKPVKPVKSQPVKIQPKIPKPPDVGGKVENLAKERDTAWDKIISGKDRSVGTIAKAVGLSLLPLDLAKVMTGRAKKPEDYLSAAVDLLFIPLAPLRGAGVGARAAGAALKNLVKSGAKAAGRVAVRTAGKEVVETGVKAGGKMVLFTGFAKGAEKWLFGRVSRGVAKGAGRRFVATIKPIGRIRPVIPGRIVVRPAIKPVARRVVSGAARGAATARRLANRRVIRYGAVGLGAFGAGAMLGTRPSPKPSQPAPEHYPEFIQPIQPIIQPVDEMAASMMQPLEQIPVFGDIAREARKRKMSWLLLGGLAAGGFLAYRAGVHKKVIKAVT